MQKLIVRLLVSAGIFLCGIKSVGASSAPTINAVQDAASFTATFSPGSIASIFGKNLALGTNASLYNGKRFVDFDPKTGVKVYMRGMKCPLVFVSPAQINFQVPWELPIGVPISVQVLTNSIAGNTFTITLGATSASVYAKGWRFKNGIPQVGVAGELYGNGFGAMNPAQVDGVPAVGTSQTTHACSLTIGGVAAKVTYCGMSPSSIINQLNFVYPSGVQGTGATADAIVKVGDQVSASINVPLPLTLAISPASVTIPGGKSQQFHAVVTGAENTAVTWGVSGGGTITQSGLYTAPMTTTTTNATVTAVAKAGSQASAQAQASVTVERLITLSAGNIPPVFYADSPAVALFVMAATGVREGDTFHNVYFGKDETVVFSDVPSSGEPVGINASVAVDTPHFTSSWIEFYVSGSDGAVSNVIRVAVIGKHNQLVLSADRAFVLEPGGVHKFNLDGSPNGYLGATGYNLAYDSVSNFILFAGGGAKFYNPDAPPVHFGGTVVYFPSASSNNGKFVEAVAAKNGYGCVTQPDNGLVSTFVLTNLESVSWNPPMHSNVGDAGNGPWSPAMATLGNELNCIFYSRESASLGRVSVPDMTVKGMVTLRGFTPKSKVPTNGVAGGWDLVALDSGSASGTAAVLSLVDNALALVDLTSMTPHRVSIPGNPYEIAADMAHGSVVVALADTNARLTRFMKVDALTGNTAPLTSTAPFVLIGFKISPDGQFIYAAGWDTDPGDQKFKTVFRVLPNQ